MAPSQPTFFVTLSNRSRTLRSGRPDAASADDVTAVVLEHGGHDVADEAAEGMLGALEPFLAPYAAGE